MGILHELQQIQQSVWLDNLSRTLLREGHLQKLIIEGVCGVTSNPTIFHKAVSESPYYREDLDLLRQQETDAERRYEALVIQDIQAACDAFLPLHRSTHGDNGYVSLEVSPQHAYDAAKTISEAHRLASQVNRPNLLIKVPGTPEGVLAFEELTAQGISVNVTLLFSLAQTLKVFEAYIRGARRWLDTGGDPKRLKAVASLFLSRVDSLVDKRLDALNSPEGMRMRGQAAVAMAKLAYQHYKNLFHGPLFADLKAAGVRPQYLLWASSGTKNPTYSDLLYVEPLMGAETINTLPDKTLAALIDHGKVENRLESGIHDAEAMMLRLEQMGISPRSVGEELQQDGVRLFSDSYGQLLELMH